MDEAQKSSVSPSECRNPDPLAFAAGVLDALRGICASLIGQRHLDIEDARSLAADLGRRADLYHGRGEPDRALPLDMLHAAVTDMIVEKQKIDREIVAYCMPEQPGARAQ